MMHLTLRMVEGPRPPLGVLMLEDGTLHSVDRTIILGREPSTHPGVVAGIARPVVLDDPEHTASRVHAEVVLEGWAAKVVDRGSRNGTELIPAGSEAAVMLERDQPVKLDPGARFVVGKYTVRFESSFT